MFQIMYFACERNFSLFSSLKCANHMISKHRKISLTGKVYYFMDLLCNTFLQ